MGYLYETHLHTAEGSACGREPAENYVPYYKSLGYDGIFVTDHFWLGNTAADRSLPWPEWVHAYMKGYREAKAEGDRLGLKVFFGWETTYQGDDFLVYGLDEAFLLSHPDIIEWDQKIQYEEVKKAGGLVVQAHPYRSRSYISNINLHPYQCDAWEIANRGNDPYENYLAKTYALSHGMTVTCGSDIHWIENREPYAMETEKPLETSADYVKLILSGEGWKLRIPEEAYEEKPHSLGIPIRYFDKDNEIEKIGEKP